MTGAAVERRVHADECEDRVDKVGILPGGRRVAQLASCGEARSRVGGGIGGVVIVDVAVDALGRQPGVDIAGVASGARLDRV